MKRLFLGFILGLIAGVAGYWYVEKARENNFAGTREAVAQGAGKVKVAFHETIGEIKTEDIQEELARTGTVVREKARKAGEAIADATADARITATIKAKLLKEPGLSSFNVHVETTDGLVTLSGAVSSPAAVAKCISLALGTEGVKKVISTLQVR